MLPAECTFACEYEAPLNLLQVACDLLVANGAPSVWEVGRIYPSITLADG